MQGDRHVKRALKPTEGGAAARVGPKWSRPWGGEGPSRGPRNGRRRALKEMKEYVGSCLWTTIAYFPPQQLSEAQSWPDGGMNPRGLSPCSRGLQSVARLPPSAPGYWMFMYLYKIPVSPSSPGPSRGPSNLKSRLF